MDYSGNLTSTIVCILCTSGFESIGKNVVTSCGHCFHRLCLYKWLDTQKELNPGHSTCPNCRSRIRGELDIMPIFYDYFESNEIEHTLLELHRDKNDLAKQVYDQQAELYSTRMELRTAKGQITRLKNKITVMDKKMTKKNAMSPVSKNKKTSKAEEKPTKHKITKSLRSRDIDFTM